MKDSGTRDSKKFTAHHSQAFEFDFEFIFHKSENTLKKDLGSILEIVKKISLGKINKFKDDNSLLTQDWVMDPKLKVKDVINMVDSKSLKIKDFIRIKIGE